MHEALPVFLALALMNMILGSRTLAINGAIVFLVARVCMSAYLSGRAVRTLCGW